jgi:hypothetical protein
MAINYTIVPGTLTTGVQGPYPLLQDPGYEGLISDSAQVDIPSYINTGASIIWYGALAVSDAVGGGAKLISSATDVPLGISVSSKVFEDFPQIQAQGLGQSAVAVTEDASKRIVTQDGTTLGNLGDPLANPRVGYAPTTVANLMRKGRVWVVTSTAVNVGDLAHVYFNADPATKALVGRWTSTGKTGFTALLSNAQFVTRTTGAGLAVLEINGAAMTLKAD